MLRISIVLLLAALASAQDDPLVKLMGGPQIDKAAIERGKKTFEPACGFCHGLDARGKSGPDLVRSTLVLHDSKGETIGPVIRAGRAERGMPAFASMTPEQIGDLAAFLHSQAAGVSNRFSYEIKGLMTGDPKQGEIYFNGAGKCNTCHSAAGDLAHVATKYQPVELQRRFLNPVPNWIDQFTGKQGKPPAPTKVTVMLSSGETVSGDLIHLDEFDVELKDAAGWHRSFSRDRLTNLDLQNPRAQHEALLATYTDRQMHNMLAYLETLQ